MKKILPKKASFQLFSRITHRDVVFFTKYLATMIKAGIPIQEAIETLRDQTKSSVFQAVLHQVLSDITNGKSLASSFKKHPRVFDQFYVSLIEIGEESATLDQSLAFLSVQLSKDAALRSKISGALLYPGIVLSATIIMGSFISLFILPQLVDFFSAFDVALPWTTKVLLFVAVMMKSYGIFIIGALFGCISLVLFVIRLPLVVPLWHRFLLRIPLLGEMLGYAQLARFSRNLGIMLRSGVPVTRALDVVAQTLSNAIYQKDVQLAAQSLKKGTFIADALEQNCVGEFPSVATKMIRVGEKTGKLDETLLYLGDYYEDEIDAISKNLSTMLEPILLLTIGLVVAFVALAIISPIYELTGSIRR